MGSALKKGPGKTAQEGAISTLTRQQRVLHALFFVLLPWLLVRGEQSMARRQWGARPGADWRRGLWLAIMRSRGAFQVLSTLNYFLFVRFGR